jgi:uncharacterized protein with PIN domain
VREKGLFAYTDFTSIAAAFANAPFSAASPAVSHAHGLRRLLFTGDDFHRTDITTVFPRD